jgi:hypothetical protein
MRTTIDLPDDLFRRAKSQAALRGRKLKDLVEEGLRAVVDNAPPDGDSGSKEGSSKPKKITAHDLLHDLIFDGAEGPTDLSTNPKYFDDFGR